jgi:hypothetical protein
MPKSSSSTFLWVPGHGPDPVALARMAKVFPKPKQPMGEAWFMGEVREMYPELLGDLGQLSDVQIYKPLEELASGISSFGQLEEWIEWYHYLLPRLLVRPWSLYFHSSVELLVTAHFELHPATVENAPYEEFRADALLTLGRYIMASQLWPDGRPDHEKCLHKFQCVDGSYGWYDSSGLLSASLFFCLKYLPAEAVKLWFESVLAVGDPYWHEQIIVWLVGAYPILTNAIEQPAELPEYGPYQMGWDWSHVLRGNYTGDLRPEVPLTTFLPEGNREALLEVARELDVADFFGELETNAHLEELAAEAALVGVRDRFMELYGNQ